MKEPEWPPGFLEAGKKYPDFEPDSLEGIWENLANWRKLERAWPFVRGDYSAGLRATILSYQTQQISKFKARMLEAVFQDDRRYLRKLLKALGMPNHPRPKISTVQALRAAFLDIVSERKIRSKHQWPYKQEVVERAKARLKEAGQPVPGERQLSRCLRGAGLWALPTAPRKATN